MFNIDSKYKMTLTAGDTAYLIIKVAEYELKEGDILYFSVSNEKQGSIGSVRGYLFQKKITEFVDGNAEIKISPRDTWHEQGRHYYDVQVTRANGDRHTVIPRNIFEIIGGVTYD